VWKGDQFNSDFLKINPNAKIPAIVDQEGPGGKPYTIFESGAILMYLAEKTGRFLPKDTVKKYDVLQWLMFQVSGVGPMFGQFTHFKMFAPKDTDNSYSMARYQTEVKRLYEVLEKRLAEVLPWRRRIHDRRHRNIPVDVQSRHPGCEMGGQPNLARWFNAISERPAVKVAITKVGAIKSNRDTATEDQKDRFFNRGRYARA
jgi:GSH-dependent disulfide-bond oxidoreductase